MLLTYVSLLVFIGLASHANASCARLPRNQCDATNLCFWDSTPEEGQPFCRCASKADQQYVFAMDRSGSVGSAAFDIEKKFVCDMIKDGITEGSPVSVISFGSGATTHVTFADSIAWGNLRKPVCDIVKAYNYPGGSTNMLTGIEHAIAQFQSRPNDDRQRVLLLITDGNPVPSSSENPCDGSARAVEARNKLHNLGVKNVIVGVGSGYNPNIIDCLWDDPAQLVEATEFTDDDLHMIREFTDSFLCPEIYSGKLSEVRLVGGAGEGCVYMEMWNSGEPWSLRANPMNLHGLVTGRLDRELKDAHWEPDKMLVLYHGRKCRDGQPKCMDCNCRNGDLRRGKCDNAIYVECNTRGAPCKFDRTMKWNDFWFKATDSAYGKTIIDYDEERDRCVRGRVLKGWSFTLQDPANSDDRDCDQWRESCHYMGTPGAIPLNMQECEDNYMCMVEQCEREGDDEARCRGRPKTCRCGDMYHEHCDDDYYQCWCEPN